jgi:tetratricopeptide (TPR) repeat protein
MVAAFPDLPDSHYLLAAAMLLGRGETRGVESFERTVFDPDLRAKVIFLRRILARFQGDTAKAIQLDRESPVWEGGDYPWAQEIAAAMTLAVAGDGEAARPRAALVLTKMQALREKEPRNSWLFAWIGMAHALLGQKDDALAHARKALEILPESRDALYGVENAVVSAAIHAWVGERDHALAEFERLLRVPHGTNAFTGPRGANARNSQVWFQPLWTDPRFQALVADPRNRAPLF